MRSLREDKSWQECQDGRHECPRDMPMRAEHKAGALYYNGLLSSRAAAIPIRHATFPSRFNSLTLVLAVVSTAARMGRAFGVT